MSGVCYIISGGDLYGPKIEKREEDYIIAADAGYRHLDELKIECDMVLGDFDSIMAVPQHEYLMRLNQEKDDTDTLAAIRIGMEKGYQEFHIYGATGGLRIDHTMANIQCLAFLLDNDKKGYLYDHDTIITMIRNGRMEFDESYRGYASVMSYSEISTNVNLQGFKYELENATLMSSFPIGVSNEFAGKPGIIAVKDGTLFITYEDQTKYAEQTQEMEQEHSDEDIN
ncbi:MAG: thiamine diphosphokinase [Hespellia sp.]|nr:thiamine diphosphokinase [Hespellia sp.]